MDILKRWRAVLAWSGIGLFVGVGFYGLANLNQPYIPWWTILIFFLVGGICGALYISETQ